MHCLTKILRLPTEKIKHTHTETEKWVEKKRETQAIPTTVKTMNDSHWWGFCQRLLICRLIFSIGWMIAVVHVCNVSKSLIVCAIVRSTQVLEASDACYNYFNQNVTIKWVKKGAATTVALLPFYIWLLCLYIEWNFVTRGWNCLCNNNNNNKTVNSKINSWDKQLRWKLNGIVLEFWWPNLFTKYLKNICPGKRNYVFIVHVFFCLKNRFS